MGEFSDKELHLINSLSQYFQADIDRARVAELIDSPEFDPYDFQLQMFENPGKAASAPPEIWAAIAASEFRDTSEQIAAGRDEEMKQLMTNMYVTAAGSEASFGLQLIKDLNEFWRFEPTVEAIFDFDSQQLEEANRYMRSFQGTDHEYALRQNKEQLLQKYKQWEKTDLSTENINFGRDIYEDCLKICERGFPNLLAIKRILDGESPDVEELQRLRASKVRRELTNEEDERNSVFFDLIVGKFDSTIRNGIAHNDIISDPSDSVVRIPSKNSEYDYEAFNNIVKENLANAIFLTGAFRSLVEWHAATVDSEYREERPDWVFGECSLPEDFPPNIDHTEMDSF